jgi:hypothetical protein
VQVLRRRRLKAYMQRLQMPAVELCRRIDRLPSHVSDLLNGRKSFGEKAARHIEHGLALPEGYLDSMDHPDEPMSPSLRLLLRFWGQLTPSQRAQVSVQVMRLANAQREDH